MVAAALRAQLQQPGMWTARALDWRLLDAFYTERGFRTAWVGAQGPMPRAAQWRRALEGATAEGLNPDDYAVGLIASAWSTRSPAGLARLDLLLSDAFLRYSVDVRAGRLPPDVVDPLWHIAAPVVDPLALLRTAVTAPDFDAIVRSLPPPHAGYVRLRAALARYERLEQAGGWPTLPPGRKLRYGVYDDEVPLLRRRLLAEGDLRLGPARDARFFDEALRYAVERFQVRYGLQMDGVVGAATRAAMNLPIAQRIAQIKANMQRWRWLPRRLGNRYLMVNSAGYELTAVADGHPRFTLRVIIGKPERPTPAVSGPLHTVVFNPDWTVPPTITFEDFVPAQRSNPDFLKSRGIRVFAMRGGAELNPAQIDWSDVDEAHFPYVLRQDPGPTNPLGHIKFLFSNDFDIYLHDTPSRGLFARSVRTFSAGCIRVEDPAELAGFVLDGDDAWPPARIRAAMASGVTTEVRVPHSVPTYVVYWTAWVGEDDAVHFRDDIYTRDRPNGDG